MTYRGTMRDGVIVLDGPDKPAEGSVVTIEAPDQSSNEDEQAILAKQRESLKRLVELGRKVGQVLPTDASRNVDHYLYGAPKR